ncbi:MAG: GIY-YIG nuclease family protein [Patescibacteria group bacterium]
MYWIYILKNKKNDKLYIGSTPNLKKRIKEHNDAKSKSTKADLPWIIVYTEGYLSKQDALKREHNLKYFGKAYAKLKDRIKDSLRSV